MPRGFTFRLDPYLRSLERTEAQRRRDIAQIESAKLAIQQRIADLRETETANREAIAQGLTGSLDLQRIRSAIACNGDLAALIARALQESAALEPKLEAARARLREAAIRRRSVERLREIRLEEWRKEVESREARQADDLLMGRYGRGTEAIS